MMLKKFQDVDLLIYHQRCTKGPGLRKPRKNIHAFEIHRSIKLSLARYICEAILIIGAFGLMLVMIISNN